MNQKDIYITQKDINIGYQNHNIRYPDLCIGHPDSKHDHPDSVRMTDVKNFSIDVNKLKYDLIDYELKRTFKCQIQSKRGYGRAILPGTVNFDLK